jgi:two-component system sensor histidine kinase KdpD
MDVASGQIRYIGRVLGTSSSGGVEEAASFTPLKRYLAAVLGVAALTLACWLLTPFTGYGAISLIYLLGVLLAGMVLGRGPVLLVATLSALSWNFLFIPPRFTLHIDKLEDALTFLTYFVIALTVGGLTAQLKAREHLAAQVQLAKNSERLRKTLLDCVSHELKTPLAAIGAASQELLRLVPDAQNDGILKELAAEIHDGSHRLNRVVNNLLDMNRLESGVVQPNWEWCDVRELLHSAIEIERDSIDGREVRVDVPENAPLVLVDHLLMEQAIAKLLANAGSYTPSPRPIEVDAECRDGELTISVSDRGPGLPAELSERVFEKFFRGEGRAAGGLGLGLAIARGFVEAHGGTITAENRDGGGARFTINLPVRVTDPSALDASS